MFPSFDQSRSRALGRKLAVVGLGLVVAASLSACAGASGGPDGGTSASSAPAAPVTLNYTIWDEAQKPTMQKIADNFHQQNPNVTVDISVVPLADYWSKLQTTISAGSGPDVFWMNGPHIKLYAANNAIAPLDDQGIKTSDYAPAMVDLYTHDGKLYGAPKDFDTIGVWYNKKLFDDAGVPYPKAGWTWDDFKSAAAKTTNKDKGVWGIATTPYGQMSFYNTMYQAGATPIAPDGSANGFGTPEGIQGIDLWTDFVKQGYSPTLQQVSDTYPGDTFGAGKLAMWWDGSWAASTYAKSDAAADIQVAPLPMGPKNDHSVIHGLANVANAKGQHLAEAKKFAAYASGKEAADLMAATGTVIPAFNGTQDAWVKSLPQFDLQVFIDEAKTADSFPASMNSDAWQAVEQDALKEIYSLKGSAADVLAKAAPKIQELLDKE